MATVQDSKVLLESGECGENVVADHVVSTYPRKKKSVKPKKQDNKLNFNSTDIENQMYFLDAVSDGIEKRFLKERMEETMGWSTSPATQNLILKEQFINYSDGYEREIDKKISHYRNVMIRGRLAFIIMFIVLILLIIKFFSY